MTDQKECKHTWTVKITKFGPFEVCKKCGEAKQIKSIYGVCHGGN